LDKTNKLFGNANPEEYKAPKFIQHIETSTIEWCDSKLTFASVIARSCPTIEFLCFKHSENKLFHLYTLNFCPPLENEDPERSYLDLPSECKMSKDCHFMTITTYGGEIKFMKMVPMVDAFKGDVIEGG
jgi:hypothetical protein